MKTPKSLNNKLKAAIVLTFLLLVIFGKNILDRKNFNELEASFISVYEDRLVVESYIFSISENLFRIKLLVNHCWEESDYSHVLEEIEDYEDQILKTVETFETTNLTDAEEEFLGDFKGIIMNNLRISDYESLYSDEFGINTAQVHIYNEHIERAITDLEKLSLIQIEEGRRLADNSEKVVNRSRIWAQFEIAALAMLLLIIYLLIYTSRNIKSELID
ncbi:Four helix bundle sensory module for signal transduction [Belliella buryatensis]|uniref:Four helix bundle sensory module for signal transduction n=1 Tax=Belliella buryatensis TaxID=1500549 RepID=A0A239FJM8_9BACT|nr:MCP four helix bundle domain-containing protein [Belliella buryatensis]SNS56442.1 Four helix bundle sensory module for signal transduction [Belliella buryatensis]